MKNDYRSKFAQQIDLASSVWIHSSVGREHRTGIVDVTGSNTRRDCETHTTAKKRDFETRAIGLKFCETQSF